MNPLKKEDLPQGINPKICHLLNQREITSLTLLDFGNPIW
jgi:hypothetical protein